MNESCCEQMSSWQRLGGKPGEQASNARRERLKRFRLSLLVLWLIDKVASREKGEGSLITRL
jgi:hypothetical protein